MTWETTLIAAIAVVGAELTQPRPTANRGSDVVLLAALAAGFTIATSIAPPPLWIVVGTIAAVGSVDGYPVAAIGLETVAVGAALIDKVTRPVVGSLIGAGAVQLLLRLGEGPFHGSTALLTAAAVAVLMGAVWKIARRPQVTLHRLALVPIVLASAAIVVAAVSLFFARGNSNRAIDHVRAGLDNARRGDTESAGREFAAAAEAFSAAHREADAWWTKPALLLPVLGPQISSIDQLTAAGRRAAEAASEATSDADVNGLRMRKGTIDLQKIVAAAQPLSNLQAALAEVRGTVDAARSPWLLPPLASKLETFSAQVERAVSDAELAQEAIAVTPSLLGGEGPRRYLVVFANPSEARDLGGFVGGYGELVVDNGTLDLVDTGRVLDLNGGPPRTLSDPSALPERFRAQHIEQFWQNVTGSPDFPTVAEAIRQLWPQSGGAPLDGVLYVDPYALSALLRVTGPVTVSGLPEPLSTDNVVDFLTKDQYISLQVKDERHDLLSSSARVVFDRLTKADLPGPRQIADILGPPAHAGRLLVHSFHPHEQQLFTRLGIDGALPALDGDFLSVTTSNSGGNKIDAFLRSRTDYSVIYDPATGQVDSVVRVTLDNAAPSADLPDYLIGNHLGLPLGTNAMVASVTTPLALVAANLDGAPVRVATFVEYGRRTYSFDLAIPPGASPTLELHLSGPLPSGTTYRLTAVPKPRVGTEALAVQVRSRGGWRIGATEGVVDRGDSAEMSEDLATTREYSVVFDRS